MTLNKSTGNMYEWITHTWNPLGGKCPHACSYCSTNKFYYPELIKKYLGEPRLIEKELTTNLGKGNLIFVAAQNDLFAKEIPDEWIVKVLDYCNSFDNKYLFQSKNPKRFLDFISHKVFNKSVICTTIESDIDYCEVSENCPSVYERAEAMNELSSMIDTYVTIEPILKFSNPDNFRELIYGCQAKQVNIGASTSKIKLPEPTKEELFMLIEILKTDTIIKEKSNLKRLLK